MKLVGACDPAILHLADGIIPDHYPGVGPIGGILSALAHCSGPIFVLVGDMPSFGAAEVAAILIAAERHPAAQAILASPDRMHPCAGVYMPESRPVLQSRVSCGHHTLLSALDSAVVCRVTVSAEAAANVNQPTDIAAQANLDR